MAAPVLNASSSPILPTILEGATNPAGITVAGLVVDGSITDPDGAAVEAIAVKGLNTSLGAWQYSLDGGANWQTVRADLINSTTNELALHLGPTDKIRLLPFGHLNGTLNDAMTFRAWDQSNSGTVVGGAYAVIAASGGGTAYSVGSVTAAMIVNGIPALNAAPHFAAPIFAKVIVPVVSGFDYGQSVTLQSDGKIVAAGISFDSVAHFSVIRLNVNGSLDTTFNGTGKALIPLMSSSEDVGYTVTMQSDGKIIVAGQSHEYGGNNHFSLVRLNTDGSLDTTFNGTGKVLVPVGDGHDIVNSVTVQSDGKIIVAGSSTAAGYPGYADFCLVRLNTDGSLDTTFNGTGKAVFPVGSREDTGSSVTVQSDGKILVAGTSRNGTNDFGLVRLNPDGSLDTTFNGTGKALIPVGVSDDNARCVTLQSDGKIVVAGNSFDDGNSHFSVIRLNVNGSLDTTFNGTGTAILPLGSVSDSGNSVTIQSDGKIVVAGESYIGNKDFSIVRLNADGSLDATFNGTGRVITPVGSGNDFGRSVAIQSDGRIVVAGSSNSGDYSNFSLIRLNADGSLDTTFGASVSKSVGLLDAHPIYSAGSVVLDSDVQVGDAELQVLGNYSGATLTLSRHGGASASDLFVGSGSLSTLAAGAFFTVGGTSIGKVVANSGGVLQLGFNSSATQSLVSSTLQQIAYSSTYNQPTQPVQIDWTFSDGNTGAQGSGGAQSVTGSTTVTFNLRAPVLQHPVADINARAGKPFNWTIAADAFTDLDIGDTLTHRISMANGTALPSWLSFDAASRTLSGNPGMPGVFDVSEFDITVTTTDQVGRTANDVFRLGITQGNSAPTGAVSITGTAAPGQTLTVTNTLADLDGLGTIGYQWLADGQAIDGAIGSTFVPTKTFLGRAISVKANYIDNNGTLETVSSAPISLSKTVNIQTYAWKTHSLLSDVSISIGVISHVTAEDGAISFEVASAATQMLTTSRAVPSAEASLTSSAVNLQDAIAILKMIVGLDVNGAGRPLSPYQALAADYDGNGAVQLTDAIGVLKHVVGLTAPHRSRPGTLCTNWTQRCQPKPI